MVRRDQRQQTTLLAQLASARDDLKNTEDALERMRQIADASGVKLQDAMMALQRLRAETAPMRLAWKNMRVLARLALTGDHRLTAIERDGWRITAAIGPMVGSGNPIGLEDVAEWFAVEP